MTESKHVRCKRLQCDILELSQERDYRENEKATISDRLISMRRQLVELQNESRRLSQITNLNEPIGLARLPLSFQILGAQIGAKIYQEQVDAEIRFLLIRISDHESNLASIERRLDELEDNLGILWMQRAELRCGGGYLPGLATREDCNLPPIKPWISSGRSANRATAR